MWINGKKAGFNENAVTPFVAYVTPGEYTFALTSDGPRGATRAEKNMTVELNQTQNWMAAMREQTEILDSISHTGETTPEESLSRPYTLLGWSLFGTGVASGVGGLIFTFQALDTHNQLGAMSVTPTANPQNSQLTWAKLNDELEQEEFISWTFYGIGAALIGTGIGLLLVEEENSDAFSVSDGFTLKSFWGTGASFGF